MPCEEPPPIIVDGFRVNVDKLTETGKTVSVAVLVTPPYVADRDTGVEPETRLVFAVKDALVEPAGTTTLAGTVAAAELLARATLTPPAPAGPLRFTVPWDGLPPVMLVGFRVRDESPVTFGPMVSCALIVTPP
jgi:hypothetical protein